MAALNPKRLFTTDRYRVVQSNDGAIGILRVSASISPSEKPVQGGMSESIFDWLT